VNRVVAVLLDPKAKQSELVSAITPVEDRLMKRYRAAQTALRAARELNDADAADRAQDELNSLQLFRSDMIAYGRVYTFLSQIFDYGNTDIEKRALFYKVLVPLLEFGREREGIDLSKVVLTHHTLKDKGAQPMQLSGDAALLTPVIAAGTGAVQVREKAYLSVIIEKLNDLFQGELSDQDKLVYVNNVLKGKLLESETLQEQALNNTKEQFANSPDLKSELMNAIIGALDAHNAMSGQALASETVRKGLRDILLDHAQLYESLRNVAAGR
jgi:type I restriction enzyme R subunit